MPEDNKNRYAHVVVVLPDRRIILQRQQFTSYTSRWEATVHRNISSYFNSEVSAIDQAGWAVSGMFMLSLKDNNFTHAISGYVPEIKKKMDLILCRIPSQTYLKVLNSAMQLKFLLFSDLLEDVARDKTQYDIYTVHAVRCLSHMMEWTGWR